MISPKQWGVLIGIVLYSLMVWHISAKYTSASYETDKNIALETERAKTLKEQQRADALGKKLAESEALRSKKQTVITKEVIREVEKPVYRECHTTDDGVRIIEDAIDNANEAISQ